MKKTIGIIGGMGPLATVDLFGKIVKNTPAKKDQDHIRVVIDNNTDIPDRTAALLEGGADPAPQMIKSVERLVAGGADVLIMPCNTAHGFLERVREASPVPVLNMIELTCQALVERGVTRAGLLATTGTIQTGIYHKYFKDVELLLPDEQEQQQVMALIYDGVKAGKADFDARPVQQIAQRLLERGAQSIILGCTELPLAMSMYALDFPATDPTLELAKGAVAFARGLEG
jgi:aspartate racemase